METILLLEQTAPLFIIILIILALCLGIIFYLWSMQNLKNIELKIVRMKNNISNLEYLSQSIYETTYFKMKKSHQRNNYENTTHYNAEIALDELKEIKEQIQYIIGRQAEIDHDHKSNQKVDISSKTKRELFEVKQYPIPHFPTG